MEIEKAVAVLRSGGVLMHPTETCYGLAVDIFNPEALKKLYKVKKMAADKPVSILVDGLGMAQEYAIFSDKAFELAKKHWPGPLSILLPRKRSLPEYFNPGSDYVSLRWSSNRFCEDLLERFGGPLTTTSANLAGEEQLYEVDGGELVKAVDFVVDHGKIAQNKPSTIVKVEGDRIEVLRQGGILCE